MFSRINRDALGYRSNAYNRQLGTIRLQEQEKKSETLISNLLQYLTEKGSTMKLQNLNGLLSSEPAFFFVHGLSFIISRSLTNYQLFKWILMCKEVKLVLTCILLYLLERDVKLQY